MEEKHGRYLSRRAEAAIDALDPSGGLAYATVRSMPLSSQLPITFMVFERRIPANAPQPGVDDRLLPGATADI